MTKTLIRATFALNTEDAWLNILPAGPLVVARDGRAFQVSDPTRVAANTETPVLLDWEHNSEKWDGSTEAAGWGEEIVSRPTGLWMRTAFTPKGAADIASKAYRFVSPVLELDADTRDVQSIASVALTNRPALRLLEAGTSPDAYRAHVRGLRETYSRTTSSVSPKLRARLQRDGLSDAEIDRAAAHQAALHPRSDGASVRARLRRAGVADPDFARASAFQAALHRRPVASDAEVDAFCIARGMSAAEIQRAREYLAAQRAARGES